MIGRLITFGAGLFAGALLHATAEPLPGEINHCEVYKVAKKTATSYVLMPPAIEHCEIKSAEPIAQKSNPAPEALFAEPTPVSEPIEAKAEEEKPHRRHRHIRRHRRYY